MMQIKMMRHGLTGLTTATTILFLCSGTGAIITFVYGWVHAKEWQITKFMWVWTGFFAPVVVVALGPNLLSIPNDAADFNDRAMMRHDQGEYEKAILDYNEAIRRAPTDSVLYFNRGMTREATGVFDKAIEDYTRAIELEPEDLDYYSSLAWVLATSPNAKDRDGDRAVESARKACEGTRWGDWNTLDTLAAAYAEIGNFPEAVTWQKKAIELAPGAAKTVLDARQKLYEAERPYRSPTSKGT
jgi:tetratricopeptide (TPR) repeat protein